MSESAKYAQAVEITTAAYDRLAADYAERNETITPHWAERLEAFVDLLAEAGALRPIPELGRPGDDASLEEFLQFVPVLDAGCGPGRDARALASEGYPVLGVDLSQGMIDEAIARTPRRLPCGFVRYAIMDLRRLELPDGSCQGVWCSASLLHVRQATAPRVVAELARVLRRGGPFALFVKQRQGDIVEEFVPYAHGEIQARRFFSYYTEDEVRAMTEAAGLNVLDIQTWPDERPDRHPWISLLARKP